MNMRSIILQIAVATLAAAPAFAHHGTEAYDLTKTITSHAVATGITWANPHCLLNFDTTDAAGHVTHWSVELYNPGYLARAGWTMNSVKAGDEITISFHPAKNGASNGYIRAGDGKIVLHGEELSLTPR